MRIYQLHLLTSRSLYKNNFLGITLSIVIIENYCQYNQQYLDLNQLKKAYRLDHFQSLLFV